MGSRLPGIPDLFYIRWRHIEKKIYLIDVYEAKPEEG